MIRLSALNNTAPTTVNGTLKSKVPTLFERVTQASDPGAVLCGAGMSSEAFLATYRKSLLAFPKVVQALTPKRPSERERLWLAKIALPTPKAPILVSKPTLSTEFAVLPVEGVPGAVKVVPGKTKRVFNVEV